MPYFQVAGFVKHLGHHLVCLERVTSVPHLDVGELFALRSEQRRTQRSAFGTTNYRVVVSFGSRAIIIFGGKRTPRGDLKCRGGDLCTKTKRATNPLGKHCLGHCLLHLFGARGVGSKRKTLRWKPRCRASTAFYDKELQEAGGMRLRKLAPSPPPTQPPQELSCHAQQQRQCCRS